MFFCLKSPVQLFSEICYRFSEVPTSSNLNVLFAMELTAVAPDHKGQASTFIIAPSSTIKTDWTDLL